MGDSRGVCGGRCVAADALVTAEGCRTGEEVVVGRFEASSTPRAESCKLLEGMEAVGPQALRGLRLDAVGRPGVWVLKREWLET